MTFCNHVLCNVRFLVDKTVVFLEPRVFSSLAKDLHLALITCTAYLRAEL